MGVLAMGNTKELRELFARTYQSNVTVAEVVSFLELNDFYKDAGDEDVALEMLSAYKHQEARRFLGGIKEGSGHRVYANYKDGSQNFYTNINNEAVSAHLQRAETALHTHIRRVRGNYENVKAKRIKAQAAERRFERAARRASKRDILRSA